MAHVNASSAALSVSVSSGYSQAPLGGAPTQAHLQTGYLQTLVNGMAEHTDVGSSSSQQQQPDR